MKAAAGIFCPRCGRTDIRHSHEHRRIRDAIMAMFFRKRPFRCRACSCRFYFVEETRAKKKTHGAGQ